MSLFADRRDAGRRLAAEVARLELADPVVLALPRGGVPVAVEVASALDAPLDVFVVRKLGAPGHAELGVGAVAEDGTILVDDDTCRMVGATRQQLDAAVAREREELTRRITRYRGDRPLPPLTGRDVVVVDDGLATGVTARAALAAIAAHRPRRRVLAVPVCAPETAEAIEAGGVLVVCLARPPGFSSVGSWYDDFTQTTDREVLDLLGHATDG